MKRKKWKLSVSALIFIIFIWSGIGLLMYPSTAAWFSQYHESQAIRRYQHEVAQDLHPGNEEKLRLAREYNADLAIGKVNITGEHGVPQMETDTGSSNYWDLLSTPSGLMGRLRIPAIGVDLPIYHGTSAETLDMGVGHLQGTSLPVGGIGTHSVLTAHTGLADAIMFDNLHKLKNGDTFTVSVAGEVLTYEVFDNQTVLPNETGSLAIKKGEDIVTLVTCTPLGINTHRYLVTGKRITPTPISDLKSDEKAPSIPGFPWWAIILSTTVIGGVVFLYRSGIVRVEGK